MTPTTPAKRLYTCQLDTDIAIGQKNRIIYDLPMWSISRTEINRCSNTVVVTFRRFYAVDGGSVL